MATVRQHMLRADDWLNKAKALHAPDMSAACAYVAETEMKMAQLVHAMSQPGVALDVEVTPEQIKPGKKN